MLLACLNESALFKLEWAIDVLKEESGLSGATKALLEFP